MPWTKFHYTDYLWEADKAIVDTKGKILSLEMFLSPSITIEGSFDKSGNTFLDAYNNIPIVGHSHPKVTRAISKQIKNN